MSPYIGQRYNVLNVRSFNDLVPSPGSQNRVVGPSLFTLYRNSSFPSKEKYKIFFPLFMA